MAKSNTSSIRDFPYVVLIEKVPELRKARSEYQQKSHKERWMAADWVYGDTIMSDLLADTVLSKTAPRDDYNGFLRALAIDPTHAGALLSVGSMEFQNGRPKEGMALFHTLTTLPPETEEILVIIEKACEFLCGIDDYENALELYLRAIDRFPEHAEFYDGASYCHGKLGNFFEAVKLGYKAVDLNKENYPYLSNLGWSLIEIENYAEAEEILLKAIAKAPNDYPWAKNNMQELKRRLSISQK